MLKKSVLTLALVGFLGATFQAAEARTGGNGNTGGGQGASASQAGSDGYYPRQMPPLRNKCRVNGATTWQPLDYVPQGYNETCKKVRAW